MLHHGTTCFHRATGSLNDRLFGTGSGSGRRFSFNPEPAATGYGANAPIPDATTYRVILISLRSKYRTEDAS